MSGDMSWMKKGLKKRAVDDWFSEPKAKQCANSSTPGTSKSARSNEKKGKSSKSNAEKDTIVSKDASGEHRTTPSGSNLEKELDRTIRSLKTALRQKILHSTT
ncbi:hypothetical protein ABKN59_011198 [Abortiporus biennis]